MTRPKRGAATFGASTPSQITIPLLTLVIPTYNRAANLQLLLSTLQVELAGLEDMVTVLVSDNASTDHTPVLVQAFQAHWPKLVVQRHAENVGADGNFASCVCRVESRYFWIIGDDDLPKRGVVAKIVELLRSQAPDILYLGSEWVSAIDGPEQGERVTELRWRQIDALAFAKTVNVWFTFISATVINRQSLQAVLGEQTTRRFLGTNLVQLGWIYPLLKSGSRFILVSDRCVLATKDNTGGYGLMTVFGVNFPRITRAIFGPGSTIGEALISRAATRYLPGLIWTSRHRTSERFLAEAPWGALRQELGSKTAFWALLMPIGRFPKVFAFPVFQLWRVINLLGRQTDRFCSAIGAATRLRSAERPPKQ